MYQKIITWLEAHQAPCFYKKHIGIECPGCGMQRATIELLKGNFSESFFVYPALIPIIILFIYLFLHLIFKFKKGAHNLIIIFIFTTAIIIINFIIKLLT